MRFVLGSAAIVLCVYAVSSRRSLVVVAVVLAIPAFLHRVLNLNVNASSLSILNVALGFLFDMFIAGDLRRVFATAQRDLQTHLGRFPFIL